MSLAVRLFEAREMSGLSRRQACRLLGAHDTHVIEAWEDGAAAPSHVELQLLADLYDVRIDWLADGVNVEVDLRPFTCMHPSDVTRMIKLLNMTRRTA